MQKIIVILIIAASAIYLGWKFFQKFYKKETGCDKCAIGEVPKEKK